MSAGWWSAWACTLSRRRLQPWAASWPPSSKPSRTAWVRIPATPCWLSCRTSLAGPWSRKSRMRRRRHPYLAQASCHTSSTLSHHHTSSLGLQPALLCWRSRRTSHAGPCSQRIWSGALGSPAWIRQAVAPAAHSPRILTQDNILLTHACCGWTLLPLSHGCTSACVCGVWLVATSTSGEPVA